ncbi:formin-binding protein 1-like Cip4 isoform X12 [Oratosquilla oratoria]|uniref:formin-binding protein 1-like Cip4 isoform X12 n=1 Tax=Oratosquilla oratoria TaxID=337810 RepID=UPI003F764588
MTSQLEAKRGKRRRGYVRDGFARVQDQWDCISGHTQKGISFLENYGHFIRDRCQIEMDYARSLRRLVRTYSPKKKDEDYKHFSSLKAFKDMVNETADMAGQHEVVYENLTSIVQTGIANLIKELKEERKKHLSEGARVQQQLAHSLQQLEKAKKNYEKAFRESEKAQENYQKADADLNLSRAEVEKQRMNASIKSQQCEDSKNEYANQLQKSNELQRNHYNVIMPQIFQTMQDMDEKRINDFRNLIKKSVDIERSVFPIINKCLDGIVQAADNIDEKRDSQYVIERYKSGFTPPGDIPFDDLSTPRQNGDTTPNHTPTRHDTIKGTISASKLKKRGGIFGIFGSSKNNFSFSEKEDFSDLPPNQRRKRIHHKIEDINTKLNQETAAKDGLLKMKEVYEGNPSLGDPMSIMGQLTDSCQRIEKLSVELQRYKAMLEEVESDHQQALSGAPTTPNASLARHYSSVASTNNGLSPRSSITSHRNSLSDESLSRSSHSPESGIGMSHNSLPGSETYDQPDSGDPEGEEFYVHEALPIIGTCRALYAFEAQSEGSMGMAEGEELHVIELDQGDGWTRVRRTMVFEEGFVPTSYIELTLSNEC